MTPTERTLLLAATITPLRTGTKLSPDADRLLELDYLTDTGALLTVTPKGRAALAASRAGATPPQGAHHENH